MKCSCGFESDDDESLEEHIYYVVNVVGEPSSDHRETRN